MQGGRVFLLSCVVLPVLTCGCGLYREALGREIDSVYRELRGFPLDGTEDLLDWAEDFHDRYGYR